MTYFKSLRELELEEENKRLAFENSILRNKVGLKDGEKAPEGFSIDNPSEVRYPAPATFYHRAKVAAELSPGGLACYAWAMTDDVRKLELSAYLPPSNFWNETAAIYHTDEMLRKFQQRLLVMLEHARLRS